MFSQFRLTTISIQLIDWTELYEKVLKYYYFIFYNQTDLNYSAALILIILFTIIL